MMRLRTNFVLSCISLVVLGAAGGIVEAGEAFAPRFYAFENGVRFQSVAEGARVVKDLGYDGIGSANARNLPERLKIYDEVGIKLFSLYLGAQISPKGASYDPAIPRAIQQLKGRKAVIELTLRGNAPNAHEQAVKVVREIADMAAESGLRVVLYPHHGFYVARIPDALRIVKSAERKNLGVMFNLCHFLRGEKAGDLERTIAEAAPHIFSASICGADRDGKNWKELIQTLDRGTFDQARLLRVLGKHGFRGAIGLQCYAVPGDPRENLKRSIAAWRKVLAKVRGKADKDRVR